MASVKPNMLTATRLLPVLLASFVMAACGPPEDPARAQLRARLKQEAQLSPEELGRLLDEVSRSIEGKTIRFTYDGVTRELDQERREVVLGMLKERPGVFDEGLLTGDTPVRVINGPAKSTGGDIDPMKKLSVDIETLLPRRFEFTYGYQGMEEYIYDLQVD